MDKSKDDDAYPNDVPLELEASNSDVDDLARIQSEHQNRLLRQLHQAREERRLRTENLEHEAEQQDTAPQSHDDITDEEPILIYDEHDRHFCGEPLEPIEESKRLQAKSSEHEPEQQDNATQNAAGITDEEWDKLNSENTTDLPAVPGPKLARFRPLADPLDIKFEEPLHEGRFSHIWKVSCRGYVYALKIFKPGMASVFLEKWNDDDCPLPRGVERESFESLKHYTDPFFNECRVYGRLKRADKEHLAIDCYGYVMFSSAYLEGKGIDLGTSSTSDPNSVRGSKPGIIHEGLPEEPVGHGSELIYALLKELPPSDATTRRPTAAQVRTMAKDLLSLHKLGIFHASISHSSYVAGKLVDFSTAQTATSPWLDGEYEGMNPARIGKDPTFSDQEDFDEKVVDYWNAQAETPTPDAQEKTKGIKGRSKQRNVKKLARAFTPEHKTYHKLRGGADREFLVNMRIGDGWFNPVNSRWRHPVPNGYRPTKVHVGKRKWPEDDAESIERQIDPDSGMQSPAKKPKRRNGGAT